MSINDDFYKLMLEMGEHFKAMGLELEMPPNSINPHGTVDTYQAMREQIEQIQKHDNFNENYVLLMMKRQGLHQKLNN
ncbi:hypothetical protein TUM19329_04150 [Legionella antarctica]|uniref:Uncharacterized protein n=1 Tax=Legionella antarctica TaxID=2708020 RepID=A0A6F8T050_9GAMM|nr:hypothetical protein [Legionella antarctica]BCA94054.1 hypothetical protein TUM19329_04150 [Legionella antarctica]